MFNILKSKIYSNTFKRTLFIKKTALKPKINKYLKPEMKRSESKMEDSKIKENKKKVKRAPTVATATLYDILHFSHNTADYSKSSLILRNSLTGKKYLIGSVSEGFQRLVFQHNTGVQFSSFYLTGRLNWSSVSGLPGCLITIADALEQLKLKISYPNNYLKFLLATTRHFILRKSINIDVDTKPESKQEDGFTVTPLITYPVSVEPGNIEKESFSESELQQLDDIISTVFKQSLPAECVTEGENNMDEDNFGQISLAHQKLLNNLITKINIKPHTTSYHIKFENIKGTFNAAKANELNVPNGRERGILSNGKSITLTDGTIVTPDQVMGERKSFADILVLDIPDNSYLSNMKKEILESNPDSSVDLNDTDLYYIFLSSDFNINQDFIEFLEVLKKQTSNQAKIFVSHPKISPNEIMYDQFLTKILKKKKKLPNNYPVPNDDRIFSQKFFESYPSLKKFLFNEKEVKMDGVSNENTEVCLNNEKVNVFCSRDIINNKARNSSETNINCLTLNIKDRKEFDLSEKINQISKSTKGSLPLNPVFFKTLDSESAHEVEVMTLGTASACPGISANVSGNLLKVPYYNTESKEKSLVFGVLDAGEGTLNTMRRLFNENNIKYVFENFKFLYLSHLHADHHLGFVSLIQEWYKYNFKDESARLYVICPSNFFRFLVEALANEPLILEKIVGISCEEFKVNKRVDRGTYLNFLYKGKLITEDNDNLIENCYDALNMEKLETVAAIHCAFSYSVAMTFKTSIGLQLNDKKLFKISYSGDTRPSNRFATKIGLETDLLIHEATFPNEFQDHAFKKKHSTVGEALKVAEKMNCDNVVLTHFSQRTMDNIYKDILPFVKQVGSKQRFTCIANDGLIVSSESLPKCCEVDVQRAYKLMKRTSMTKTREGSDSDSE